MATLNFTGWFQLLEKNENQFFKKLFYFLIKRELKCPLDDFELLINSINKNQQIPFCPYCFNNPPFPDMLKSATCLNCSHPTCSFSYVSNAISQCFECNEGVLVLDSTTPPKYRVVCNK